MMAAVAIDPICSENLMMMLVVLMTAGGYSITYVVAVTGTCYS